MIDLEKRIAELEREVASLREQIELRDRIDKLIGDIEEADRKIAENGRILSDLEARRA